MFSNVGSVLNCVMCSTGDVSAVTQLGTFGECVVVTCRMNDPYGPGSEDTFSMSMFHKLPEMKYIRRGK